jgi:hypothetical protein
MSWQFKTISKEYYQGAMTTLKNNHIQKSSTHWQTKYSSLSDTNPHMPSSLLPSRNA